MIGQNTKLNLAGGVKRRTPRKLGWNPMRVTRACKFLNQTGN